MLPPCFPKFEDNVRQGLRNDARASCNYVRLVALSIDFGKRRIDAARRAEIVDCCCLYTDFGDIASVMKVGNASQAS